MNLKKTALIAGVAAAAQLTTGAALAGAPVVYGKANISVQAQGKDAADSDNIQWKSNASRLGVKGKHKVSSDLQAFYKAEFEIDVDNGDGAGGSPFKQRNIYAGLKGGFGAVQAGKFDTPTKIAIKKVDLFNDYDLGDIGEVLQGENRKGNQIQYTSPKIADAVVIKASLIAGEETGAASDTRDGPADGISVSATYNENGLYIALAHDNEVVGTDTATTRLAAQYKMDALTLGAAVQVADYDDTTDRTGFLVSAAYKFGANTVKAQYSKEQESEDDAKDGDNMFSIGIDHKLNKKVKVYAFHTSYDKDTDDSGESSTGVGLEVKF